LAESQLKVTEMSLSPLEVQQSVPDTGPSNSERYCMAFSCQWISDSVEAWAAKTTVNLNPMHKVNAVVYRNNGI